MMSEQAAIEPSATEEALATGLISVDTARRVGWAKAFEAIRRVDTLEEQNRILEDEKRALRRAYSRALGVLVTVTAASRTKTLQEEIDTHLQAEHPFRHEDAWDSGTAVGRRHIEEGEGEGSEWARRARRDAIERAASRQVDAEIRDMAEQAGHRVHRTAVGNGEFAVGCSCGDSRYGTGDGAAVRAWTREHNRINGTDWSQSQVKTMKKKRARTSSMDMEEHNSEVDEEDM